jgi:hypothetical protein
MSAVSAFNWKEYTDQEHARNGDPFKKIKRDAEISALVTANVHKIRSKNPSHGTIHGITAKRLNIKNPEMMESPRAKTKK